ncbi:hypothetical protein VSDG_07719 [Cytospora chrysosperma]|uniref:Heterokaryon incompatibility domain-containing protein n=1 Tax=Cytospora chrysosperma TaxID=252740 RepID=A0A423VJ46_CYTCH|nr:hypothetical protein VSDG_07719 [Valsa sordida]
MPQFILPELDNISFCDLQACIDEHDCGDSQTADLPTRLLDLDSLNPNEIKLILTANLSPWTEGTERPRYAALSYCWGAQNNNTHRTTPSNLQQHMKAIRVSDLPRTLQETVWVARYLGIRYLWIDALCIIQRGNTSDSDEADNKTADTDWQYESTRMHLVYGNALVTIVAAAASHSDGGLILSRCPTRRSKLRECLHEEPLSGRAWALQEWALSSRRLVFSNTGTHFVCDYIGEGSGIQMRLIAKSEYYTGWHKLVSNYCSRDLTNPRDKLTGFSGLAQIYAKRLEIPTNDYLSGLWRHLLLRDLLWKRTCQPDALNVPRNRGRQPGRAPTWSWASIDGNVELMGDDIQMPEAKIQNCQVELAVGDDVFGQVKSGILEINCPFMSVSFHPIARGPDFKEGWWAGGDDNKFYFYPDDESELEGHDLTPKLPCLLLGWAREDYGSPMSLYGIVVRPDYTQQCFVRIGLFRYVTSFYTLLSSLDAYSREDFKIV